MTRRSRRLAREVAEAIDRGDVRRIVSLAAAYSRPERLEAARALIRPSRPSPGR